MRKLAPILVVALILALVGLFLWSKAGQAPDSPDYQSEEPSPQSEREATPVQEPQQPIESTSTEDVAQNEATSPSQRPSENESDTSGRPPVVEPGRWCNEDAGLTCGDGYLCDVHAGQSYCAPAPRADGHACDSDDECAAMMPGVPSCCAVVDRGRFRPESLQHLPDGPFRFCQPLRTPTAQGGACGSGSGQQGDSCYLGGVSDCDGEQYNCVESDSQQAFCALRCDLEAPNCPEGHACRFTQDGVVCIPVGNRAAGSACGDDITACGPGLDCVTDPFDSALSYCAQSCMGASCPEGLTCYRMHCVVQGDLGLFDSCTEDRFGCRPGLWCRTQGARNSYCTQRCEVAADCPIAGSVCNNGQCTPGRIEVGEPCGHDPAGCPGQCWGDSSRFDENAICVSDCLQDADCDNGLRCRLVSPDSGLCVPAGNGEVGADCSDDRFACRAELRCTGPSGSRICVPSCVTQSDCPPGYACDKTGASPWVASCRPEGDAPLGSPCSRFECGADALCENGVCRHRCNGTDVACPSGFRCVGRYGPHHCVPEGGLLRGEPCATKPDECADGLVCSSHSGEAARCTGVCESNTDCEAQEWCYSLGRWGRIEQGQCLPYGDLPTGQRCDEDPDACQPGLRCMDTPDGPTCLQRCTGFPDSCPENQTCRFVGHGQSYCLPVGVLVEGEQCSDDPLGCDEDSWCVFEELGPVCRTICSLDFSSCPDGGTCQFVRSGLGVCTDAEFADPGAVLDPR